MTAKTDPLAAGAASMMVEWVVPPSASVVAPTEEQSSSFKQFGRTLPTPELLQPTLDPGLPLFSPAHDPASLRGSYRGGASDVLVILARMWLSGFKTYYPHVSISLDPPYAGSLGAVELARGNLELVFVSRELRPSDVQDFRAAFGYDPLSLPVSGGSFRHFGFLDAMCCAVHHANPIQSLSLQQLDAIFSTTRHRGGRAITTWDQVGLGDDWADKPIQIYGIRPWNGFEEFMRQKVLSCEGRRGEWRSADQDPHVHWNKLVFDVARDIARDPYALGYTGLAFVDAPVKILMVGEPPLAATYDNVALARYPLSRLTYLNARKKPGEALDPVIAELARYILSREGQQIVRDHAIFLPLPGHLAAGSLAQLDQ